MSTTSRVDTHPGQHVLFSNMIVEPIREVSRAVLPAWMPDGRYWLVDELDGPHGQPTGWTELVHADSLTIKLR